MSERECGVFYLRLPTTSVDAANAIRPLRYWRSRKSGSEYVGVNYGNGAYVTNSNHYQLIRWEHGWTVERLKMPYFIYNEVAATGIFDEVFQRRCDAVHALETITEALGYDYG